MVVQHAIEARLIHQFRLPIPGRERCKSWRHICLAQHDAHLADSTSATNELQWTGPNLLPAALEPRWALWGSKNGTNDSWGNGCGPSAKLALAANGANCDTSAPGCRQGAYSALRPQHFTCPFRGSPCRDQLSAC